MSFYPQGNNSSQDRSFLRNKFAQITSLAFVQDFPHRWPTFFTDLIGMLSADPKAVDIYLRVLLAIDSEVVDREIGHTNEVHVHVLKIWYFYVELQIRKVYCIQGKFCPCFIFAPKLEGKFKTVLIEWYLKDYVTKLERGRIQDWAINFRSL